MEEKKLRKRKEKAFIDGNQEQLAKCCNNLGDFYNQQGKYQDAVKEYDYEAEIYSKLGQKLDMAKAHRMVGEMLMLLSEFDNALKHINIYLKIVQELKNTVEIQRSYATLGRSYLLFGQSIIDDMPCAMKQLKNAEKAFIQSLLICKELTGQISKIELLNMQARLYLNIGVVKEHMEDFEQSISYMEKAIKLSKANDIYELLHLCYISVCLLYQYKKCNSTLALRFCNLALDVAERLPDKVKKVCETLIVKSEILIRIGDFQSTKQVLHKAYKMKTTNINDKKNIEKSLQVVIAICNSLDSLITVSLVDYKQRKQLYEKLGDGCCLLLNYKKAIEFYLKMLECAELSGDSKKELIPIYVSLYQTYKDKKDYEKALEYLWKEYELNQQTPTEAFDTLCNIGEVCELQSKPYWTIHDVYEKAIEQAKKIDNKKLQKIGIIRLWKIQKKYNMFVLADELQEEAKSKGIDIEVSDEHSETECSENTEENTPDIGADICLDDLSDSNSEYEQFEKQRSTRNKGTCFAIKRNNKGETQLHQACISGNIMLARRLIDQGHLVNVRDHAGWLPLHEACNHGFRDIVELILDNGGASAINDKGGTSCDGITPLYDACSNGYLDVVELLLERGANASVLTDFGDNPLNILDKWRKTANLDSCEQCQYESIRTKLVKLGNINISLSLTHTNSRNKSFDKSVESLTELGYSDEGENSDCDVSNRNDKTYKQNMIFTNEYSDRNINALKETYIVSEISNKRSSAKMVYKTAMENIKHPNRLPTFVLQNEQNSKRRGALLDPEEIDDDNWLDNDVEQHKKKKKITTSWMTTDNEHGTMLDNRNIRQLSLPVLNTESSLNWKTPNNKAPDAFARLLDSTTKQKTNKTEVTKLSNSSSSGIKKYQSSLLEKGFCRFTTFDDSDKSLEPDSTTNNFFNSPVESPQNIHLSGAQILNSQMPKDLVINSISFKIKVEDELLLVPVDRKKINEINIKWLAEEASRRYYNIIGLKPTLRLMTVDGFAFEETDKISSALEENMIASKVIEWNISPLSKRYEEMCHQLNQDIDDTVRNALQNAQTTNTLSLENFFVTLSHTESIFKSILHQSNLRILDLSNNLIQNAGCKQLGKSLSTLKLLKILNLQGNNISSEGLTYLISSNLVLNELETINLSYNPLGNQSLQNLETLCKNLGKLSNLYLSSCSISDFYKFDLKFNELTEFDVSFNSLSKETIKNILMTLNSCRLQYLNLNFITKNGIGPNICELLENGTCDKFKEIELAGCNLIDVDIYKIVQNLCKSVDIETINLIGNSRLTSFSLQYILEKLPQINQLKLDQCPQIVDISALEKLNLNTNKFPKLITLQLNSDESVINANSNTKKKHFLKQLWFNKYGDRGKFYMIDNYICLYLNDANLKNV